MINKFAAAAALFAAVLLAGCAQPTAESTKFAGTATKYFVAHAGGYLGEAVVTTDDSGNVTAATLNEWQGPSAWAAYPTGETSFAGGEMIRFKMAGKNSSDIVANAAGYAYFVYNKTAGQWFEFSIPANAAALTGSRAWTLPTAASTGKTWDALMALPLYAKAYAEACKSTAADAMQNVSVTQPDGAGTTPVLTVVSQGVVHDSYGNLNKSDAASKYMPVNASGIGYKNNTAALIKFFKDNPVADYLSAVTTTAAISTTDAVYPEALTAYTAATDSVWTVADVVTGATYSDFISYATELQNAYIAAVAEVKTGNLRAIK